MKNLILNAIAWTFTTFMAIVGCPVLVMRADQTTSRMYISASYGTDPKDWIQIAFKKMFMSK